MKRVLLAAVALMVVLVPTSAWARGGSWQPVDIQPFDAVVCEANMHFDIPVNQEYYRIVHIGGQDVVQVTGNLVVIITNTDTSASITVNASGPTFTPEGANETSGRGNNIQILDPNQAASAGLPEMFVNSGYIDIVFNDDDTVTVKTLTGHLTDLCDVLT